LETRINPFVSLSGGYLCFVNTTLYFGIKGDYDLSIDQRIPFVAGGPIASLLGTLGSWCLLSVTEQIGFLRIVSGSVFVISLIITLSTILPIYRIRYTTAGQPVYKDSYQIFRLIRMKYR